MQASKAKLACKQLKAIKLAKETQQRSNAKVAS
jgi:hypothetical protein